MLSIRIVDLAKCECVCLYVGAWVGEQCMVQCVVTGIVDLLAGLPASAGWERASVGQIWLV